MMETITKIPLTLDERATYGDELRIPASWGAFLDLLERNSYRAEYDGEEIVSIMGYATFDHELIVGRIIRLLGNLFEGQPYQVLGSNLALQPPGGGKYYYNADCTVVKGEPEWAVLRGEMKALTNPSLLVEVLSSSTYRYDLGDKFYRYKNIPELQQILYIDSTERRLYNYTRPAQEGEWLLNTIEGEGAQVPILGQGELSLAAIYEGVG